MNLTERCGGCVYTDRGYSGPCLCGWKTGVMAEASLKEEYLDDAKFMDPNAYRQFMETHPNYRPSWFII